MSRRDTAAAFRHTDESSPLEELQRALASDAAILRYSPAAPWEIVVFVVRRGSLSLVRWPIETESIADEADRLLRADDAGFGAAASAIHDLVFAPLEGKLDGVSTIAVVPTAELNGVPFSALFDKARGEYLAERFTIVHAPTAKSAVDASARARAAADTSLLAIGASEFDHDQAEALPAVDGEAFDVAALSRCARVFAGAQATPDAIERELAESAIIHYAGHIVRRGADPRLLLAPGRGRDSLSAREIAAFRLQKPGVAVLAACRGARGDSLGIVPTMAQAFLEAGVPTVIASAYDVDDREAPPTMRRLHAFLSEGVDPAEALRRTTVDELQSGRGVPVSIRFHAMGGASSLIR